MNIGDDWFTRSMLINTLNRTGRVKSPYENIALKSTSSFAEIFTQYLLKQETPDSSLQINSYDPQLYTALSNKVESPYTSLSSPESLQFQSLDSEQLNSLLAGKLRGMGGAFVRAGQTYNIDPALLAAIAMHETGNGNSRAAREKNNIAGMMGSHGLKSYATVEESILDMARNLSKNYLNKGFTSIEKIGSKYAPIGADNDPTNLNNYWVSGVTKYFNKLKV